MSFSFNPGQTTQAGAPMSGGGITAPTTPEAQAAALAVPDSPFLFMQQRGQEMSIMAYVQIVLAMVSVLAVAISIILFSYGTYLSSGIETKKAELLAKDATFKDFPLDDMKKLSKRFGVLGDLLKEYVSVRSPLKMLEDVVEKQVVFDKFSFTRNLRTPGYTMTFTVITTNYQVLIQQLEALDLAQYSKIISKTKVGSLSDTTTTLRVEVTTPVFAQGILPEEVVFVAASSTAGIQNQSTPVSTIKTATTSQ